MITFTTSILMPASVEIIVGLMYQLLIMRS